MAIACAEFGVADFGVADFGVADFGVADFVVADSVVADFVVADFVIAGFTAAIVSSNSRASSALRDARVIAGSPSASTMAADKPAAFASA